MAAARLPPPLVTRALSSNAPMRATARAASSTGLPTLPSQCSIRSGAPVLNKAAGERHLFK